MKWSLQYCYFCPIIDLIITVSVIAVRTGAETICLRGIGTKPNRNPIQGHDTS